nr:hypothetical protein GCM10025699_76830 [Microbacterium flavescens]
MPERHRIGREEKTVTYSYLPPLFEQLAARLRQALPGIEIAGRQSDYAPGSATLRMRLGHRLYLDLADDGRDWFVAGLSADDTGITPVADRSVDRLGLPLHSDQSLVAEAVVASIWRWVDAVGPGEADAPSSRVADPRLLRSPPPPRSAWRPRRRTCPGIRRTVPTRRGPRRPRAAADPCACGVADRSWPWWPWSSSSCWGSRRWG